jgi:hypothetical protein
MNLLKLPKKPLISAVVVLLLSLLAACGPAFSIHPLYTDKDVVFDPALLGTWVDPTDDTVSPLIFERGNGNSYKVIMQVADDASVDEIFDVHLVKLGNRVFLDAVQTKNQIAGREVEIGLAVPAHILGLVSVEGNVLHMSLLDQDWLETQLRTGTVSLPHEDADGTLVLTASTPELQKFVLDHADDAEAFPAADPLQRKK